MDISVSVLFLREKREGCIFMKNPLITIGDIEIGRVVEMETAGCIPTDTFPKADIETIKNNSDWLYPHYIDSDNNLIMSYNPPSNVVD